MRTENTISLALHFPPASLTHSNFNFEANRIHFHDPTHLWSQKSSLQVNSSFVESNETYLNAFFALIFLRSRNEIEFEQKDMLGRRLWIEQRAQHCSSAHGSQAQSVPPCHKRIWMIDSLISLSFIDPFFNSMISSFSITSIYVSKLNEKKNIDSSARECLAVLNQAQSRYEAVWEREKDTRDRKM